MHKKSLNQQKKFQIWQKIPNWQNKREGVDSGNDDEEDTAEDNETTGCDELHDETAVIFDSLIKR